MASKSSSSSLLQLFGAEAGSKNRSRSPHREFHEVSQKEDEAVPSMNPEQHHSAEELRLSSV